MKKLIVLIMIVLVAGCNVTFRQVPSKCCPEATIEKTIVVDVPPFKRTYYGEIIVRDGALWYVNEDGEMAEIK